MYNYNCNVKKEIKPPHWGGKLFFFFKVQHNILAADHASKMSKCRQFKLSNRQKQFGIRQFVSRQFNLVPFCICIVFDTDNCVLPILFFLSVKTIVLHSFSIDVYQSITDIISTPYHRDTLYLGV
jgi:hypothetical protein